MPFSAIIGQERAVGALRAALRRGTLHERIYRSYLPDAELSDLLDR